MNQWEQSKCLKWRKLNCFHQYLPPIVENSNNKHGHEKDGYSFSPHIVRPVKKKTNNLN